VRWRFAAGLAAALAVSAPACGATDAPVLIPTRDVTVTYRTEERGQVLEQRLRWSAATRRLRVEPPSPGMFVLVDYAKQRMQIVREPDRTYVDMAAPPTLPGLGAPAGAGLYKKSGADRILGLACTEWEMTTAGRPAGICVTEDGVMLRARIGERILATAASVSFGPQDAALFAVPPGFSRVEPPR
jgi:hypothetical protein